MVVREEDRADVGQPDGAQQLALRALAAVEEQAVAAAADERRRQPASRRGHRAGGAGEEDGEVHPRREDSFARIQSILREFRAFILRGNLVDLAVAVVVGTAFGASWSTPSSRTS